MGLGSLYMLELFPIMKIDNILNVPINTPYTSPVPLYPNLTLLSQHV